MRALSSKAYLSLRTTNLDPDNLIDVSKSILLFFEPSSMWDLTSKERSLIFPTFLIILFDFSSLPIGTSSFAILGKS